MGDVVKKESGMTPKEMRKKLQEFAAKVGPRADVYASFNMTGAEPLHGSIYPDGITGKYNNIHVDAETFEELLASLAIAWDKHQETHNASTVRKMALQIIQITFDIGACTDAALRDRGDFTDAMIRRYGADAVEEANKMADRGPFSIIPMGAANAA